MADTATLLPTLDPFSTTRPKEQAPIGGRIGFFESDFEETKEGPVKPHEILGSISFNAAAEKVGEGLADAAGEAIDLAKYILGVGGSEMYTAPQGRVIEQAENVAQRAWENSTGATTGPSDLEKARFVAYRIKKFEALDQSLSIEERKTLMSESLRMTGRVVADEEVRKEGYLDKTAIATLVGIARKDQEEAATLDQQKEDAEIPNPAKQASALNAALEGGSGTAGSSKVNLSTTGGGAQ